ncbi:hypothetical protein V2A60_005176 [Cordyceps javanica]|uniref:Nucleolar protein 12 n=1 Tax=Cordyceps javanica TaxID=43265 RepID=A0A545VDM0_9HYPO|nr:nucleolar protein 12 [Cordyceps javanica]TQW10598.1 nucleolar protein 12 [Cordyceps javanica]
MGKKTSLLASSKAVDPHLEALFASSSGPVSAPPSSRYQSLRNNKAKSAAGNDESGDDDVLSETSEQLDYEDDEENDNGSGEDDSETSAEEESSAAEEPVDIAAPRKERKRKRKDENEDLEGKYLASLSKDDDDKPSGKRVKSEDTKKGTDSDDSDSDDDADKEDLPTHESLSKEAQAAETNKAARTVFLANVSAEAVSSKAAKKQLLAHLSAALDKDDYPIQKIESIRFRSVAFSTGSMPKRAAYITKSVMEATTHSTNAYVVFSTDAAARRVCQQLNGSEVLGRHIRVDSVAHPSPTDHRRCIFVGNLGFVDDETVLNNAGKDGEKESKKRNKVPSDVEEGLWRTFSKHGKVENVRVVRDPKTRVGKGFAYVQFYDANTVEEALLLDGKSFPPMLPRKLRVTRAKDPRKTNQAVERAKSKFNNNSGSGSKGNERGAGNRKASQKRAANYVPKMTPDQQAAAGRAGKLFGRARAAGAQGNGVALPNGVKAPERIVFEGRRASSRDALPKDLKKKVKTKRARPTTRSARRGADWKKKPGK